MRGAMATLAAGLVFAHTTRAYGVETTWTVKVIKVADPSNDGYDIDIYVNSALHKSEHRILTTNSYYEYSVLLFDGDSVSAYLDSSGFANYDLELHQWFLGGLIDESYNLPGADSPEDTVEGQFTPGLGPLLTLFACGSSKPGAGMLGWLLPLAASLFVLRRRAALGTT